MSIFNEAIAAHTEWKLKLIQQINQGQAVGNIDAITNSHLCELGQWIENVGGKYAYLPSFKTICTEHEEFHRIAGELLGHINKGNLVKAKEMMAYGGALRQSSDKLIKALMESGKELESPAVKSITATDTINEILRDKTNRSVITVEGETSVKDAIKLMVENNVGALAVYQGSEFVGFFTERGYFQTIAQKGVETMALPIADMVDMNTIYVQRDDSIERCMILMTSTRTRHLPVIQDGRLIGIVSIGDIVKKVVRYNA